MVSASDGAPAAGPGRGRRIVLGALRWAVVLFGLLVGIAAYATGLGFPNLMGALVLGAIWGVVARVRSARRIADGRRGWPVRAQAINRALFWGAAGAMLVWTVPVDLIGPDEARGLRLFLAGLAAFDAGLALIPTGRPVRLVWNALPLIGWVFLGVEAARIVAGPPGPVVVLAAPFEGTWAVGQGGRSALVNHHYPIPAQSHALDLLKLDDGQARTGAPDQLESYAAFGAPLLAPADGHVVRAVDEHPDMAIGATDVKSLVGNHVVIAIAPERFVLFAHLKRGSVAVKAGDRVRTGQVVGACGNSGNTSQPHLHLQVQNQPDFRAPGLRTEPMTFRGARLIRGGRVVEGSPRRNDRIVARAGGGR